MHRAIVLVVLVTSIVSLAVLGGCGGSSSPKPVTGVTLSISAADVEVCHTVSISATVHGGDSKAVDWYVNGIFGGEATTGTISQTNPAVFTGPGELPENATVVVKAVSQEEPSISDTCLVTIEFTVIHVNAGTGNDETGTGCISRPFKSIKRGLSAAAAGTTVLVADGTYDPANGETFPLYVNGSKTLLGQSMTGTIIRDPEGFASVFLGGEGARVRRFTIDNSGLEGNRSYTINVQRDTQGAVVDSLILPERSYFSVIRIEEAYNTIVSNCRIGTEVGDVESRGFEIVAGDTGTVVRNCVISGFREGIFLNNFSDARIEGCTIEHNTYGINTCCYNSDESNPRPDLGGGSRGCPGGNIIRDNTTYGLHNLGKATIYAKFNTWGHTPPTVGCVSGNDVCNEGTGAVILE